MPSPPAAVYIVLTYSRSMRSAVKRGIRVRMDIYGVPGSRAMRSLWMLEELGVPYENVKTNFATGDTRQPAYLKINPNGHIPALQDDDVTLWESLAINLNLARQYDTGLWPKTVAREGHTFKWSIWAMTEAEEPVLTTLLHRVFYPEAQHSAFVYFTLAGAGAARRGQLWRWNKDTQEPEPW